MRDRGNLYDNLSKQQFVEEVSPDREVVLNAGLDFYDSKEEYFNAIVDVSRVEWDGCPTYISDGDAVVFDEDWIRILKGSSAGDLKFYLSSAGSRDVEEVASYSLDEADSRDLREIASYLQS